MTVREMHSLLPRSARSTRVTRALAWAEARRHLRSPLLPVALAATAWWVWTLWPTTWSGARYQNLPGAQTPLLIAISLLMARSFHRERTPVAQEAAVGLDVRARARLLAGVPLVAVVVLVTAVGAVLLRWYGGLDLGDEPGRTTSAHYTAPELLQPVALAVLAVALGAAVGRRCSSAAAGWLLLATFWFVVGGLYWAFNSPAVAPFSIVQAQPLVIEIGPASTEPATFPDHWLITAPGPHQDHWARQIVSIGVAWWHDLWLLALAAVFGAASFPGRVRWRWVIVGAALAVAGIVGQQVIRP